MKFSWIVEKLRKRPQHHYCYIIPDDCSKANYLDAKFVGLVKFHDGKITATCAYHLDRYDFTTLQEAKKWIEACAIDKII